VPANPEPAVDWGKLFGRYRTACDLMAQLGEFDKALALAKNLPPSFQVRALWPALEWFELSEQKALVNDLLRQHLDNQLQALQELDATPVQQASPERGKLKPSGIDPFQPKPPSAEETRNKQRSLLLSWIGGIQARLGQDEAAQATALQIPLESMRRDLQSQIHYIMARSGRAQEAFEHALTLDRPQPRSQALVEVADGCLWALKHRKGDKDGSKANP